MHTQLPLNHAVQRTRPSRSGCNPRVPRAGSLSREPAMKTTMAMRAVMSVVLILVAELVSVRAQDTGLVVQVAWLGPGGVLLELEGVPTNVVIQVSEDLGSWHNQLDVSSRSNHVTVVDRDASLTNGGARFYRLRAPGVSVESAHSLWQAQALHSYTYHLQRTCWCLPEIIREADVTVREGQVVSATNVVYGLSPDPSWIPPDQPNLGSLMAIEQFFEMVVTAQQRLDLIAVSYDPSEGFPRRISVDDDFRSVDGEQEYYITWLTHSSPAPATSPTVGRSVPPDLPTLGTPTSDSIRVAVSGMPHTVRRPGYYDLPRGAVVRDAVEAAQGLSEFTWWRTYSGIERQKPVGTLDVIRFTQNRAREEQIVLQEGDRIYFGHEVY